MSISRRSRRTASPSVLADQHLPRALDGIVHVLTCGSVDDGKSSLIGRLLWDSDGVADDQREKILLDTRPGDEPDLSLLVDGLLAEREQGITIDIAWRFVDAGRMRIAIIDSPGHEQYTRNMASGASHADVAVMVTDARHGIKPQTRRHAAILDLVGVRHVVLAVNKMDLVDWSEQRFREVEVELRSLATAFGFHDARAIPLSARFGDNVFRRSDRSGWYDGRTLMEHIETVSARASAASASFRFPIQTVVRTADFRGIAGTIASGSVSVGDVVVDVVSGRRARVQRIVTMDGDLPAANCGRAVVLQLDTDLDLARGCVLARSGSEPRLAQAITAALVWLADRPFDADRTLHLRTATDLVPIGRLAVKAGLDLTTLEQRPSVLCGPNDIVLADIDLARPAVLERFADVAATGSFVLVDALSGATVAGGVVKSLYESASRTAGDGSFSVTPALLAQGLCRDIPPGDSEFRRRGAEVVRILQLAGVVARLETDES